MVARIAEKESTTIRSARRPSPHAIIVQRGGTRIQRRNQAVSIVLMGDTVTKRRGSRLRVKAVAKIAVGEGSTIS